MGLVITGIGLCTPLGSNPAAAIAAGASAVVSRDELQGLPDDRSAKIERIDLGRWLKRRKDRKLMARPAQLALAAAGPAAESWPGDPTDLGLFLGVGREQGDEGESEAPILAAHRDGRVHLPSVAGLCRDLYPPLLPLKTLPNMALAHVSINLEICGENGAWSGAAGAGMAAIRAGCWAVLEGRCPAALVGAADSLTSVGIIRDRYRSEGIGVPPPVGEAGVMFLVEPAQGARTRGAPIYAEISLPGISTPGVGPSHHAALGDCGAADGAVALALAILSQTRHTVIAVSDVGHPALPIEISVGAGLSCYNSPGHGETV